MVQAIALDMGSSQIKVGCLNAAGHIDLGGHEAAPHLKGRDGVRVSNPQAYLHKATKLLQLSPAPKETPMGISTQRSSFVLWHVKTGKTLTPLISWQDLRAHAWCEKNAHLSEKVRALTGLPLSPHYAASKLAMLFEENKALRRTASRGLLRFGTLETYLIWNWTEGMVHHTDLSMAARTQLLDLETRNWSKELLELFQVPRSILPDINGQPYTYENTTGYPITATVADQAACVLPIFLMENDVAFINAGTATFLMRTANKQAPEGILGALLPAAGEQKPKMIWEAPINAGARILRGFKLPTETIKRAKDPNPQCFAIADVAGLGAPHWRADLGNILSDETAALNFQGKQRILFESLLFRTREVLQTLFADGLPEKVILAGGLSARFDYSQTLASLLEIPLYVLKEKEMSLWGAGWMATGCSSQPKFQQKLLQRRFTDTYLREKFTHWQSWMQKILA